MKRVDLVKFGFKRAKERDFFDSGLRFTCYTVGRVRLCKTLFHGALYVAARVVDGKLTYEEYKNLEGYEGILKLNGYPVEALIDGDLEKLYQDCVAFGEAYTAKEKLVKFPSKEALTKRISEVKQVRQQEYKEVLQLSKDQLERIVELPDARLNLVHSYIRSLKQHAEVDVDAQVNKLLNTSFSRSYMRDYTYLNPSWYYQKLMYFFLDKKSN